MKSMRKVGMFLFALLAAVSAKAVTNDLSAVEAEITSTINTVTPMVMGLLVLGGTVTAMFVGYKLLRRGANKV